MWTKCLCLIGTTRAVPRREDFHRALSPGPRATHAPEATCWRTLTHQTPSCIETVGPRAVPASVSLARSAREEWQRLDLLNTPTFPTGHHRSMKTSTVVKHPPPSFFAPQPAARPRRILLICALHRWWADYWVRALSNYACCDAPAAQIASTASLILAAMPSCTGKPSSARKSTTDSGTTLKRDMVAVA